MDEQIDRWMDEQIDRRMNRQIDGWMNRQIDRWMDGWMKKQMDEFTYQFSNNFQNGFLGRMNLMFISNDYNILGMRMVLFGQLNTNIMFLSYLINSCPSFTYNIRMIFHIYIQYFFVASQFLCEEIRGGGGGDCWRAV